MIGGEHRTKQEYRKRINKVLDYIDNNLGSKLSVELLANVACFSPYHFHRIFHAIAGESVNVYIKRLRLAKGAQKLLYNTGLPITAIALECGFASHSDFSRSFKAFYNMSPKQYAETKERGPIYIPKNGKCKRPVLFSDLAEFSEVYDKNIKVSRLEDLNVAYIRITGLSRNLKRVEIENAFAKLFRWAKARDLTGSTTLIVGITLDSPEIVDIDKCRYDTCITVPDGTEPEGEIGVRNVNTGGKYIIYSYNRKAPNLGEKFFKAMDYIYGYWMPNNGYLPEDKPFIEFYHSTDNSDGLVSDFCIPVKPL